MQPQKSFRSRKIDYRRALPVFRATELPDLDETANSRAIPVIATGVEKEEEEEHHLQAALNANQAGMVSTSVFIPTPDASKLLDPAEYQRFYSGTFTLPKSYVRFSTPIENAVGIQYNMDEIDDDWLMEYNGSITRDALPESLLLNENKFETIMFLLEKLAGEKTIKEGPALVELEDSVRVEYADVIPQLPAIAEVQKWWYQRRVIQRKGMPIHPCLRTEDSSLKDDSDPYFCFRRREIKSLRKTRRGDVQSLDKLRRLRAEIEQARSILELIRKREELKKESLLLDRQIFDKRVEVRRMRKNLGVSSADIFDDPDKSKRRLKENKSNRITIPLRKFRDAAAILDATDPHKLLPAIFKVNPASIEAEMARRKESDSLLGVVDHTEDSFFPLPVFHVGCNFYIFNERTEDTSSINTSFNKPFQSSTGYGRRRIGRGGRIIFDRHYHCHKDFFQNNSERFDTSLVENQSHLSSQFNRICTKKTSTAMVNYDNEIYLKYKYDTTGDEDIADAGNTSFSADYLEDKSTLFSDSDLKAMMSILSFQSFLSAPMKETIHVAPPIQVIRPNPLTAAAQSTPAVKPRKNSKAAEKIAKPTPAPAPTTTKGSAEQPNSSSNGIAVAVSPASNITVSSQSSNHVVSNVKAEIPLDPRQAAVKLMMQQAQRQALQAQQQIHMQVMQRASQSSSAVGGTDKSASNTNSTNMGIPNTSSFSSVSSQNPSSIMDQATLNLQRMRQVQQAQIRQFQYQQLLAQQGLNGTIPNTVAGTSTSTQQQQQLLHARFLQQQFIQQQHQRSMALNTTGSLSPISAMAKSTTPSLHSNPSPSPYANNQPSQNQPNLSTLNNATESQILNKSFSTPQTISGIAIQDSNQKNDILLQSNDNSTEKS